MILCDSFIGLDCQLVRYHHHTSNESNIKFMQQIIIKRSLFNSQSVRVGLTQVGYVIVARLRVSRIWPILVDAIDDELLSSKMPALGQILY